MKTNIYVIRDKVAEESGPIFEAKNDSVAYRQYVSLIEKSDHQGDFDLLCVGDYDHEEDVLQHFIPYVVQLNVEMEVDA